MAKVLFLLENENYFYIVTEFISGGTLKEFMVSHQGLTESEVSCII